MGNERYLKVVKKFEFKIKEWMILLLDQRKDTRI